MSLLTKCNIAKLGEDVLRQKAKEVIDIKSDEIQSLINNMIDCLNKSNGVGLAAPQIFQSYQILIISSKPNARYPHAQYMKDEIIINPKIINKSHLQIQQSKIASFYSQSFFSLKKWLEFIYPIFYTKSAKFLEISFFHSVLYTFCSKFKIIYYSFSVSSQ